LFCPYCANQMVEHAGELTCTPGRMGLSKDMLGRLVRACAEPTRPRTVVPPSPVQWYCPRCSAPMARTESRDPTHECTRCGLAFRAGTVHGLIEFHPHGLPA